MMKNISFEIYTFLKGITLICFIITLIMIFGPLLTFFQMRDYFKTLKLFYLFYIEKFYISFPIFIGGLFFLYYFLIKKTPPP